MSAVDLVRPPGRTVACPAFVSRRCPDCDGDGCEMCFGGGSRGSLEIVEDFVPNNPGAGRHLRDARKAAGLYLGDAARRAGISTAEWSNVEHGRLVPADGDYGPLLAALVGDGR